jgi:transposase
MNGESFKSWFKEKFLRHLKEPSVIIMDNASYHSMKLNKCPTSNTRKGDIVAWLKENNISFSPHEIRTELLIRVKMNKPLHPTYELDQIANEMGHQVIRLPPYHCQYNPIELIWAKIKGEVASKNNTFKLADVERLTHETIDSVSTEDWATRVRHSERLQEEDYEKEISRYSAIEPLIINLRDDESSDECDESSEDDE